MVAAGSVVSCGSVLPDADACGVAIRVAHIGGTVPPVTAALLPRQGAPHAAVHDVLEVVVRDMR
jgi:hypothetical protein